MVGGMRMVRGRKIAVMLSAAVSLVGAGVWAQYTPGSGGTDMPPSAPVVPAPVNPYSPYAQPADAAQPSYSPYSAPAPYTPQPSYAPQPYDPSQPDTSSQEPITVIEAPEQPAVPQLSDAQVGDLT